MKELKKTPVEVFGLDVESAKEELQMTIRQQYCRFIPGTCNKPRKSRPLEKVGICSVASTVAGGRELEPVIICPKRFNVASMFEAIRHRYLSHWSNIHWIPEVNIGVGGSIDYVAVELGKNNEIRNFQCVELQAAGTTGTPYPAVEDLREYGAFQRTKYKYSINWANEFLKTMMQQAYKKGRIVGSWNRKIIFVIQDVGMRYIQKYTDCSLLTPSDASCPVDFCTFKMQWGRSNKEWNLVFDNIYSTTVEGVNRMIGGAGETQFLTEDEFKEKILKKGLQDKLIV